MAKNRRYERGVQLALDTGDATFPGDAVASGDPILLNHVPGVALTDEDADGVATIQLGEGVFDLSVTGEVTQVGQAVYMTSAGALNRTTTNDLFGFALATKGASAGVIPVKLAAQSDNVPSA